MSESHYARGVYVTQLLLPDSVTKRHTLLYALPL
jgi:hypothetical protein